MDRRCVVHTREMVLVRAVRAWMKPSAQQLDDLQWIAYRVALVTGCERSAGVGAAHAMQFNTHHPIDSTGSSSETSSMSTSAASSTRWGQTVNLYLNPASQAAIRTNSVLTDGRESRVPSSCPFPQESRELSALGIAFSTGHDQQYRDCHHCTTWPGGGFG